MSHFINYCACGIVLSQCRCPDMNKTIRKSKECTHIVASKASTDAISEVSLLTVKQAVEEIGYVPNTLRMSPKAYAELMNYFTDKEADEARLGIVHTRAQYEAHTEALNRLQIYGTGVIIDRTLEPGEWRFEYRMYDKIR